MSKPALFVIPFSRLTRFGLGDEEACLSRGVGVISKALSLLENRPEFHLLIETLVFVDHYLKVHPEDVNRVRKHIADGRLEVGAAWAEIGQNLQIGEDLIRNLIYGNRFAEETLHVTPRAVHVGAAPGWTPQFPQIARKSGLSEAVFTRCGPRGESLRRWEGLDGSQIGVWHAVFGHDLLWERVRGSKRGGDELRELDKTSHLPIHWGSELVQFSEESLDALQEWAKAEGVEITLGTFGTFAETEPFHDSLPVWSGEIPTLRPFVESLYPGVVPLGVPAVHALLRAEQMATAALTLCGLPYPAGPIQKTWLRQLSAMDLYFDGPGLSEVLSRKWQSQQMTIWTAEEVLRSAEICIAEGIRPQEGPPGTLPMVVFNSLSWSRTDLAEAHAVFYGESDATDFSRYERYKVVDADGKTVSTQELESRQTETAEVRFIFMATDVPPNGYATYYLIPDVPESGRVVNIESPGMMHPDFPEPKFVIDDAEDRISEPYRGVRIGRRLASRFYTLDVDEVTGRVSLIDRNSDRMLLGGIHLVGREESMNEGLDQYDYTGRRFEMDVDRVELEESGEVRATLAIDGRILNSPFQSRITIYGALNRVDLSVRLQWQDDKPVRVQVVFPVEFEGETVHYGVAYGHNELENVMQGSDPWRNGDIRPESWAKQRECQGWVAIESQGFGAVLASNRRAFEFEAGEMRSDILRSCLDPSSFAYRRVWRSYPHVCTSHYSIRSYTGDFREGLVHRDGWSLNQPLSVRVVYGSGCEGGLPDQLSFVSLEGEGVVTTVVKPAEEGEGIVIRAFETLGRRTSASISSYCEIDSATESDFLERPIKVVDPNCLEFSPFEIKTVRLVLRGSA